LNRTLTDDVAVGCVHRSYKIHKQTRGSNINILIYYTRITNFSLTELQKPVDNKLDQTAKKYVRKEMSRGDVNSKMNAINLFL